MTKQVTDTSTRSLVPEGHYDNVMITKIVRKEVKEFIIFEWSFETLVGEKEFNFRLGFFSSQMAELLRALGAKETTPNKFEWDDEEMVGEHLSFNIIHVADKKGVIREQLADIARLTDVPKTSNPNGVKEPGEIQW